MEEDVLMGLVSHNAVLVYALELNVTQPDVHCKVQAR